MDDPVTTTAQEKNCDRRSFIKKIMCAAASLFVPGVVGASEKLKEAPTWILAGGHDPNDHYWGMGIDINKCIGCGRCVD